MANKRWEIKFYPNYDGTRCSGGLVTQIVEAPSAPQAQKLLLMQYNGKIKISSWREVK